MLLTAPYLTDQLIPYIGNKRKLLPLLYSAVTATGLNQGTFFDVFAGSGVVSRLAKAMGFQVIANDWEPYSYYLNQAYIARNSHPAFQRLGGLQNVFDSLNSLTPIKGYISTYYCPEDDENPQYDSERMFYTQENGRRIDAIREAIAAWKNDGMLDDEEEAFLLAPLIFQGAYCSNTSGVFKAFHRGWGGATKTAWYRIRSTLALTPPVLWDNCRKNEVFREDANRLADDIRCDIAYIDPPYNQHQYGSNYHMLNTIAMWDKPAVRRNFNESGKTVDKSAIRLDWRKERRSLYCYKSTADDAFTELIGRLQSRYILVSYSTDGIIELPSLLGTLAARGRLTVIPRLYKRYRVSSQRPSLRPHTVEFVAIADCSNRPVKSDIDQAITRIAEAAASR